MVLLLVLGVAICQFTYDQLLVSVGETRVWELEKISNNFNVSYEVESDEKWIKVTNKVDLAGDKADPVPGKILSTKVSKFGDGSWQRQFSVLNTDKTVYYGTFNAKEEP